MGTPVWKTNTVSAPTSAILVLPPSQLPTNTTISTITYTTSLEVGHTSMTAVNGITSTVFIVTTTTITLAIGTIVTDTVSHISILICYSFSWERRA